MLADVRAQKQRVDHVLSKLVEDVGARLGGVAAQVDGVKAQAGALQQQVRELARTSKDMAQLVEDRQVQASADLERLGERVEQALAASAVHLEQVLGVRRMPEAAAAQVVDDGMPPLANHDARGGAAAAVGGQNGASASVARS